MKSLMRIFLTVALILVATPAYGNDYITTDTDDWLRYRNDSTGQEVTAQTQYVYGNWRLWSEFGGLGATWVYTNDTSDHFWLWNGTTYQYMGDLSATGSRFAEIPPCNSGTVQVSSTSGSLTTAAGRFTDVTRIDFEISCADAGTTSVWFASGVGIVRWTESSFIGEVTYELVAANVGGHRLPETNPTPTPTTTTASNDPVAPTEHAQMETIMWGANDTYMVVENYRDALRGLDGSGVRSQVIVSSSSVASQLRYEMSQANVPMTDVQILTARIDSIWMRDYGPIVLKRPDGTRVVADPEYYRGRPNDNEIPDAYAGFRGWASVDVRISFEGGNFATDGRGTAYVSNGVQWFNGDMSREAIRHELAKMGCDRVVYFQPLVNEGTTHIDMFARIMSDTHAIVSRYPPGHRQATVCDDAARTLQSEGYTVVRVDADYTHDEYGTYANSVLANGIALIPQYSSASKNAAALAAYTSLGFRAIGVDSRLLIRYGGATHCISMQIPSDR